MVSNPVQLLKWTGIINRGFEINEGLQVLLIVQSPVITSKLKIPVTQKLIYSQADKERKKTLG